MNVRWRNQFKKDYRLMMKQGKDIGKSDSFRAFDNTVHSKNIDKLAVLC